MYLAATPFLDSFRNDADRVIAAMPAKQGVLHWPNNSKGLAALCSEYELPFSDLSMDRVLLFPALEHTEQIKPLLREIWRVMPGSGRLIVAIPNRTGIWSRFEKTPFGHGLPYSQFQISQLLRENSFVPLQSYPALYLPPVNSRIVLASAPAWERFGKRVLSTFSGIVLIEASKQLYIRSSREAINEKKIYLSAAQKKTPAAQ